MLEEETFSRFLLILVFVWISFGTFASICVDLSGWNLSPATRWQLLCHEVDQCPTLVNHCLVHSVISPQLWKSVWSSLHWMCPSQQSGHASKNSLNDIGSIKFASPLPLPVEHPCIWQGMILLQSTNFASIVNSIPLIIWSIVCSFCIESCSSYVG